MRNKNLHFEVGFEDGYYFASCIEAFIVTQGKTFKSLEKNINEAVECHFAEQLEKKKFNPIISLTYTLPVHA